jgi:hypothetical protein
VKWVVRCATHPTRWVGCVERTGSPKERRRDWIKFDLRNLVLENK